MSSVTSNPSHSISQAWLERAQKVIPGASQTISKGVDQFALGVSPKALVSGEGCHVTDLEGNAYIDYCMGLCSVTLGYQNSQVDEAIRKQLQRGINFSLPHALEVEVAELLCEVIPCAEKVRFAKNGSDATSGTIRAARAITGREHVALCGYHGPQDWYIGTTARDLGVPESTKALSHKFCYNDIDSLKHLFEQYPNQIAAVILEAVSVESPQPGFLQAVADLTRQYGALLVFDEIITGFRWHLGGAQSFFNVTPDLACFGKGMANGMPISAVVGRHEYMEVFERIFFSYTFGGETLSLAASAETIKVMRQQKVIDHIWNMGHQLMEGCQGLIDVYGLENWIECKGYAPRFLLKFSDAPNDELNSLKTLFIQEASRQGVLTTGAHNLSFSHRPDDIARTLQSYDVVFKKLKQSLDTESVMQTLEVPVVPPVFRPL